MRAYGKINLSLAVLGKRDDGFHDIESIMHEVELCDELECSVAEHFSIDVVGADISAGDDNLVCKAHRALCDVTGEPLACKITLHKNIPVMAGLAGGSTDCAAALVLLRDYFNLDISDIKLKEIGATLGCDVPFFIDGYTQLATGRGTELRQLNDVYFDNILIVNPRVSVSTPDAYRWFHECKQVGAPKVSQLIEHLDGGRFDEFFFTSVNHLYEGTARNVPEVRKIVDELKRRGAFSMMSGSGPSVFAVFSDKNVLESARRYFLDMGYISISTRSRRR